MIETDLKHVFFFSYKIFKFGERFGKDVCHTKGDLDGTWAPQTVKSDAITSQILDNSL